MISTFLTNDMYLLFCFMLWPAQSLLWVYPLWVHSQCCLEVLLLFFQVFRCKNLALTRDMFSSFSLQACRGLWEASVCHLYGCTPHISVCPCMSVCPLYICTPLYICMSPYTSMFTICHGDFGGHMYISTSVRHFFVCQFISLSLSS